MSNILDIAEEVLKAKDLNFSRIDENEMLVTLSENYHLSILSRPEYELLHFSNDLNLVCPDDKIAAIEDSIIKANERIWVGHFDLLSNGNKIIYSFTIPFIFSFFFDENNFESLIDLVYDESERFYHYFKMIISDKNIPNFSLSSLFQDSIGEA